MAKIILDSDEYITEADVQRHGPAIRFLYKAVLPVLYVAGISTIIYYVFPAIKSIGSNPALEENDNFKIIPPVYLVLTLILLLAVLYSLISIFTEKIILTNKAILRRNVFSVDRFYYNEITALERSTDNSFFRNRHLQATFFIRIILGIRHILTIESGDRRIVIDDMSKHYAEELSSKLQYENKALFGIK